MEKGPLDKAKGPGAGPMPEMERLGLDPSIMQSVKGIDAMQTASWAQQLKVIDALKLEPSMTSSFKAMEALKADTGLLQQIKSLQASFDNGLGQQIRALQASFDNGLGQQIRALQASFDNGLGQQIRTLQASFDTGREQQIRAIQDTLVTGWAKHHKAIEAALNPAWARQLSAIDAFRLEPSFVASAKAFESAYADMHVNKWLQDLQTDKFTDLLRTWKAANPITELSEVVEAMRSNGLVESATRLIATNPPAPVSMTAGDIADVQAIVDRAIDRAAQQAEARMAPFVKTIVDEIQSMKDSRLKAFVVLFIVPVLISAIYMILNPVADFYIKRALEEHSRTASPREVKQNVRKKAVIYAADREQLQSFRFVLKEELEVHTHPSSKSPAVGNLALGQVVMLLERQKAWSSVAWTADDESPAVHGWVYSRYVSKIV
ncbi:SH3 domain-containing protein [Paraburkholderia sp. BL10I2N1]|uniref:SH3 domain-containing protein n=2 Tax=unclassified Paraburkholderia TaxID=2615204 RepID=UPI0010CECD47|nr:SH3 domain-containing protein [Paraburkholderia sp. BL10I2N1]TDN63947.1 SH3 domain-containing protein [Paraburkholderia sp. BL10I2N1]